MIEISQKLDQDTACYDYNRSSTDHQHRFEEVDIIKSKSINSYQIVKPFEDIDENDTDY